LLEGWNRLNNHTEPIQLWDGHTLSGHELAQYVLDYAIPIVWGSPDVCGGDSCSKRYCRGEVCTYDNDQPGVKPIYINPSLRAKAEGQMDELVDTLAHEIYHRTQPFGSVDDSLYEEYSAYYVGAHISGVRWTNFEDYNPLQPACLVKWFHDNHLLEGYQQYKAYSLDMVSSVDTSSTTCAPGGISIASTAADSLLTCTLNVDGSAACQFPPAPTPAPEYRLECVTYPSGLKGCTTVWLNQESTTQATNSTP
jgi:hypothetical protein